MHFHSMKNNGEENGQTIITSARKPSRRFFLRRTALGAAVAVPVATVAAAAAQLLVPAASAGAATLDMAHLSKADAFEEIRKDENAHVAFLKGALGSSARPKPSFKGLYSKDQKSFKELAKTFENVGVGAYLMAAPAISSKEYLAAAGSILTIEARHAGYLDALVGVALSPNGAFDVPLSQATIVSDVSPFIKSLNGGPDPAAPLTSDVDILNFALLLEFLEAEFYNINVPRFF